MRGRWKGEPFRDYQNKTYLVTFEVDDASIFDKTRDKDIDIEVKEHREKRSNNANRLLWECLGRIAASLRADKWDIYLQMLKRYGKYTYICVKPQVVNEVKKQWRECEVVGPITIEGEEAIQMLCYFGSSTYDTKEFSVLLDGVISEMKEMGLTTPSDEEFERAIETWKAS